MDPHTALEEVKSSPAYASWLEEGNQQCFLLSIFLMTEEQWEIIFFNKEKNSTSSFAVTKEGVALIGKDVPLLQQEEEPQPLVLDKITLTKEEAVSISRERLAEKSKAEQSCFVVLQTKQEKPCWIVVIMTSDMHIHRCVINAETKEVLEEKLQDLSKSFSVERKT